jgi:hypothetical protein
MSTFCSFLHPLMYRRKCTVTLKTQKSLKNCSLTMPSTFDNGEPPSDPPPPPSPQRDTNTLQMPSSTSSSRAAAIVSGIGSAVADVFQAFSPPHIFPSGLIAASPFVQSHVDSTMSATMDNTTSSVGEEEPKETDDAILQMMANNQAEGGDGGESNVEGGGG